MKAGQNHTLTVTRISDYGLYLADQEGQEVLLPNRYVSLADKVGDAVDVFVYHDSEDRLLATPATPPALRGEGRATNRSTPNACYCCSSGSATRIRPQYSQMMIFLP